MTGPVHGDRRPGSWETSVDVGFRWFLPSAAAVSVGLGLAVEFTHFFGRGTSSTLAPFLIGWGAFAGVVAFFWNRATAPPFEETEPRPVVAPSVDSRPSGQPGGSRGGPATVAKLPTGRGPEWRVLAVPASPGDETWLSWLPRESRHLGADTAGYERRALYSPGRPGSIVALPTREFASRGQSSTIPGDFAEASVPGSSHRARAEHVDPSPTTTSSTPLAEELAPRISRRHVFSEDELDRMFPPEPGGRTLFLSQIPDKVGVPRKDSSDSPLWDDPRGPSAEAESPAVPGPSISKFTPHDPPHDLEIGGSYPASSGPGEAKELPFRARAEETGAASDPADYLLREANNPVPPHLRTLGLPPRTAARRANPRSVSRAEAKSVCASCSKVVVNLRMSGPCPKCLRPICNECLREAFVTHGQGWCVDCSASLSSNSAVTAS